MICLFANSSIYKSPGKSLRSAAESTGGPILGHRNVIVVSFSPIFRLNHFINILVDTINTAERPIFRSFYVYILKSECATGRIWNVESKKMNLSMHDHVVIRLDLRRV